MSIRYRYKTEYTIFVLCICGAFMWMLNLEFARVAAINAKNHPKTGAHHSNPITRLIAPATAYSPGETNPFAPAPSQGTPTPSSPASSTPVTTASSTPTTMASSTTASPTAPNPTPSAPATSTPGSDVSSPVSSTTPGEPPQANDTASSTPPGHENHTPHAHVSL